MRKITLRSVWSHKRRLISTVVAIVLGVAFMSGTYVLADTLERSFDDLFSDVNEEVDAQVQGVELFGAEFGGAVRTDLPADLVDTVAEVDGVAAAAPYVETLGFSSNNRVLDPEGDPIGSSNGPPTLIQSWIEDEVLNPYDLVGDGQAPDADDEIALNVAAADDGGYEVGDSVTVVTQFGISQYTLVGTFKFGNADSAAGAVSAEFTLAEAQHLAGKPGVLTYVLARAEEGVSQEELVDQIGPSLPDEVEVITGEQAAQQQADDVTEGLGIFRQMLSIFGVIALIVGIFIISNTFSILIAQRTRELALLRAVGASRGQVLRSVLLEAVVVGLVAAVLGLLAGIGLAVGVTALLEGIGVEMPSTSLVVGSGTILLAFAIGLVVTVIAATIPAIRATRVPPLAALREVAIDRSGASRVRLVLGIVVLAFAAVNLSQAWRADGDTDAIPTVGLGALLALVGAIMIGPVLAGPSVRFLGSQLPRLKGVTGRLATENAARSPKRTSATASALIIVTALVGFVTIFAASLKDSVDAEVKRGLNADLIVQGESTFAPPSGFSPTLTERISELDGVATALPFGFAPDTRFTYPSGGTSQNFVSSVDPTRILEVLDPRMAEGDITDLNDEGIVVDTQIADNNDLSIGDPITMQIGSGEPVELQIDAISDDQFVLGAWTITRDTYLSLAPTQLDAFIFVRLEDGADVAQVQQQAEAAIEELGIPSVEVLDQDQWLNNIASQLSVLVNVIYGLLGISILIGMIGIANTLSLSIHERTRELGLLRAVGMARAQLRSAVRWEAVIISVLGAAVGLGLGLVLTWALVTAMEGFGVTQFAVPTGSIVVLAILAAGLGVVASIRPARRAAKLDILQAIATE